MSDYSLKKLKGYNLLGDPFAWSNSQEQMEKQPMAFGC